MRKIQQLRNLGRSFGDIEFKILPLFLAPVEDDIRIVIVDSMTTELDKKQSIWANITQLPIIVNVGVQDYELTRSCFEQGASDCVLSLDEALNSTFLGLTKG